MGWVPHIYLYIYTNTRKRMGRDRDASSVLAGYRDMLGHDQALEAAKRRAREREAYRKKAQKDEADLRVMLYTAPERETPVPSAPSASAPRAAKRRKRNRHEIAAEEDAAYMRKKRVVDAAGLRLIESEDEEDEPILNATRIVAAMERRTERPGRPVEKRDAEQRTEPGTTKQETRPVNVEPTLTKIDHGHHEKRRRTRSEIPISGDARKRPPRPEPERNTQDGIGTASHDAASSAPNRQTLEKAERTRQVTRSERRLHVPVPQAETPAAVSTSDGVTMTDVSIKSDQHTMTEVSTELDDLRKKVESLQKLISVAEQSVKLKQTTIDNQTESSATLLRGADSRNEATRADLNKSREALARSKVASEAQDQTRARLQSEALTSAEENEALNRRLDISTEQNAYLASQLERANIERVDSRSELITQIRELGQTLEAARLDRNSKEAALRDVETREAALRGTSDAQATQNIDLRATIGRMTTELHSADAEYKKIQSSVSQMAQDQQASVAESAAKTNEHLDTIRELQAMIGNANRRIDDLQKTGKLREDTIDELSSRLDKANELNQVGEITALPKPGAEPGSTVHTWLIRMEAMATRWVLSKDDGTGPMAAMVATVACSVMFLFYSVRRIIPRDTMGALCDALHTLLKWMVRPTRRDEQFPGMWVVGQYLVVFAKALLTLLVLYIVCAPPIEQRAQIASNEPPLLVPSFDRLGPVNKDNKDTKGTLRWLVDFLIPGQGPSPWFVKVAAPFAKLGSGYDRVDAAPLVVHGAGNAETEQTPVTLELSPTTQDENATRERRKNKRAKPAKAAVTSTPEETAEEAAAAKKLTEAEAKALETAKKAEEETATALEGFVTVPVAKLGSGSTDDLASLVVHGAGNAATQTPVTLQLSTGPRVDAALEMAAALEGFVTVPVAKLGSGSTDPPVDSASLVVVHGAGNAETAATPTPVTLQLSTGPQGDAAGSEETAATAIEENAKKAPMENKPAEPAKAAFAPTPDETEETAAEAARKRPPVVHTPTLTEDELAKIKNTKTDAAARQAARRADEKLKTAKAEIKISLRGTRVEEYTRLAAATGDANLVADWLSRLATLDATQVEELQVWITTGMEYAIKELKEKEAAKKAPKKADPKKAEKKAAQKKAAVVDQDKADEVTAARELTAWGKLGEIYQPRLLARMSLCHVAVVIVGSTSEGEFSDSVAALGMEKYMLKTNAITLLRNVIVQTEEVLANIAANKKDDAIGMLDQDHTNGNAKDWWNGYGFWGLGNYTIADGVSDTLRAATAPAVENHFPSLRHVEGSLLGLTANGLFDGCNRIKDRCDLLAKSYRGYAGTTNDDEVEVKKALVASLERAKKIHTRTSATELFDRTINDINEGTNDMVSVAIAATAHLGEGKVVDAVRRLIVYYHAQIMKIPKAAAGVPAFVAAVKYTEELVKTSRRPNNAQLACNLARTLAQTLKSLTDENDNRHLSFHHTHRIIARTWVDIEYLDSEHYELLQTDAKKEELYKEATSIVDDLKTDLRRMTDHKSIVAYIKYKLNDNKERKRVAEDKRVAEEDKENERLKKENEAQEKLDIKAYTDALKALGINMRKFYKLDALKLESESILVKRYPTTKDFNIEYKKAALLWHPDKNVNNEYATRVFGAITAIKSQYIILRDFANK